MSKKERDEEIELEEEDGSESSIPESSPDTLRILEALLFASDELLTAAKIKTILPDAPDARRIRKMIDTLNVQLQKERHPFEVVEIGGGYQFRTVAYYHPWVRQIFKEKAAKKLSIQALECLAIIAYKQPISKAEIEAVRGVVSDGAMKTLLEKKLVTITGRSEKPGRPLLYGTTSEFLKYFGLNKTEDLPRIEEFEAIAREKIQDFSIEELQAQENEPVVDQESQEQSSTDEPATESAPEATSVFEIQLPPEQEKTVVQEDITETLPEEDARVNEVQEPETVFEEKSEVKEEIATEEQSAESEDEMVEFAAESEETAKAEIQVDSQEFSSEEQEAEFEISDLSVEASNAEKNLVQNDSEFEFEIETKKVNTAEIEEHKEKTSEAEKKSQVQITETDDEAFLDIAIQEKETAEDGLDEPGMEKKGFFQRLKKKKADPDEIDL
ncbi:MAG: SMC-Scp complex subunit ScpB [Fibrobacter sp.]|nr:SMC-Scp complex subunit ScpB [Fibrobacter sp.]